MKANTTIFDSTDIYSSGVIKNGQLCMSDEVTCSRCNGNLYVTLEFITDLL